MALVGGHAGVCRHCHKHRGFEHVRVPSISGSSCPKSPDNDRRVAIVARRLQRPKPSEQFELPRSLRGARLLAVWTAEEAGFHRTLSEMLGLAAWSSRARRGGGLRRHRRRRRFCRAIAACRECHVQRSVARRLVTGICYGEARMVVRTCGAAWGCGARSAAASHLVKVRHCRRWVCYQPPSPQATWLAPFQSATLSNGALGECIVRLLVVAVEFSHGRGDLEAGVALFSLLVRLEVRPMRVHTRALGQLMLRLFVLSLTSLFRWLVLNSSL